MTAGLLVAGVAFVLLVGMNDGASLVAVALRTHAFGPAPAMVILTGAVALVPMVVGTAVAQTLAGELVSLSGRAGEVVALSALVAAVTIVGIAAVRRSPTSLTLALVGGLGGAAAVTHASVSWTAMALVGTLALAAPAAVAAVAWWLPAAMARAPRGTAVGRHLALANRAAFAAQCVAYGANDGQKVLAVAVLAAGATGAWEVLAPVTLLVLGALFVVGAMLGLRRSAGAVGGGGGVMLVQPVQALTVQVTSASVVLGGSWVGAPISMTQALTAAIVGSGVRDGRGRVRWERVVRLAVGWTATLPEAFVVGALAAVALGAIAA